MKSKQTNFVVLDIGSSKISAIAANISYEKETEILAQTLHYSSGFKFGKTINISALGESIVGAIYALEKECGTNIQQVAIAFSGADTKSYYLYHKIKIYGQTINAQDVKRLLNRTIGVFGNKGREIVHYFPIEFTVDQDNVVENPIGMSGEELSCQLHVVTMNATTLRNIAKCLAKFQIEVTQFFSTPYSASLACLTEDEKKIGVIFIEMGASTTSFSIFYDNKMIYTSYVPMGGENITSDIAKAFSIKLDTAEKLKILYGNVSSEHFEKDEVIRLEEFEPDNGYDTNLTISSSQLSEVIAPGAREILESLRKNFDNLGMDNLLVRSVVISGGSSAIGGMKNLVSKIFNRKTRIAKPATYKGFSESYNPHIHAGSLGAIECKIQDVESDQIENKNASVLRKMFVWVRDYF